MTHDKMDMIEEKHPKMNVEKPAENERYLRPPQRIKFSFSRHN